jgi:hypothetical protein
MHERDAAELDAWTIERDELGRERCVWSDGSFSYDYRPDRRAPRAA